jgi:hypothetical protein
MELYSMLLLLHICGAVGIFAALGIEAVALTRLRRADGPTEARTWLGTLPIAGRVSQMTMVSLVVTGLWMTIGWWGPEPWAMASLAGAVVIGVLGGGVSRRHATRLGEVLRVDSGATLSQVSRSLRSSPTLMASFWVRMALGAGILVLMTLKPGLVASIVTVLGALALGSVLGLAPVFTGVGARGQRQEVANPEGGGARERAR